MTERPPKDPEVAGRETWAVTFPLTPAEFRVFLIDLYVARTNHGR